MQWLHCVDQKQFNLCFRSLCRCQGELRFNSVRIDHQRVRINHLSKNGTTKVYSNIQITSASKWKGGGRLTTKNVSDPIFTFHALLSSHHRVIVISSSLHRPTLDPDRVYIVCDFHLSVKTFDVTVQWAETNLLRTSSKTLDWNYPFQGWVSIH